ncbi:MAG: PAS domain S-box protein, partial [Abditibacteriales bacterium]|nr:PAS domain S-box protein [Abditibacteriales bacterium]MDW8366898.1 PAS domain S-box protein [Abditibacteriales bacterium]
MFLMPLLLPFNLPMWVQALADTCLLTLLSAPVLWWVLIRPFRNAALMGQAQAAAILNHAADGIIAINEQGIIESFNPAAERIFGYKAEEVIGQKVNVLMPSPYREEHDGYIQRYLRTGERRVIGAIREVVGRRKDGSDFPLEIRVGEVQLGARRIFTSVVRDITERKAAEQQLRLHTAALESAANGIIITDRQGNIEWVNPAFTKMTGYRPEEVLGKNPRILGSGQHNQAFYQHLWETILAGEVWQGEIINRRKNGDLYTEDMTIAPVRDERGTITHFIAIKQDITYRKQAEEELRQARAAAEDANRELIALNEHLEKTLTWAKEMAMQAKLASAAKSEFLANMSHEIRTPMNGVIGMTSLLLDTDLTPEQREYAETIQASAEALLTIINDILDFSKIEAGKVTLEQIDFDLRDCVSDTIKTLVVRAHEKGLELAYHFAPDVPAVLIGDPGRLRQILLNLVGNAIKFTEQGEVVVWVEVLPEEGSNGFPGLTALGPSHHPLHPLQGSTDSVYLHFRVCDTGIGIPADKQQDIFKAFTQADGSTTRKFGGTGLGLAICKNLVEMMGGRIWVDSVVGRGSTFHFTARFGVRENAVGCQPASPLTLDLRDLPVLVVDDNRTTRWILHEWLTHAGMKPTAVESGHAALEVMRQ